jgi:hypothetical protein
MKSIKILFIISLFYINGCGLKNANNKPIVYESIIIDTLLSDKLEKLEYKSDTIIYYPKIKSYNSEYGDKRSSQLIDKRSERTDLVKYETRYNIINYINVEKLIDSNFAIIGYNIPTHFKVNKKTTIKLRISKENTIESVVIGNRNIPIVGLGSSDNIILETIKVSDQMSAKLYTDKEYFLTELVNSGSVQNIEEFGYTEWVWRVTPLKSGNSYIKMIITISGRDIVVYEKEIPVESNWSWSFSNWLTKWWQAITATIITPILIPFFIWLYNRKGKKSKE